MADVGNLKFVISAVDKTSKGFNSAASGIGSFVKKNKTALKALGVAAVAGIGFAVKQAVDFEKQMANVSTMLDTSTMPMMEEFEISIRDMSKEFGEGTETLSKGLYDILSASVPAEDALSVLDASARAAKAGLTDTGTAADAVTTIMNAYGMSAKDAGKISDMLFGIVKEGKTTFGELAPAIGRTATLASQAGLSVEEMGATIATLTRSGIDTNEAMTAMNGIITAFLKPTDEATKAAAEFGIVLNTDTLKTEGLTGVMEKLTDAEAEQLAQIFPNIRGLAGMSAALGDTEGFTKSLQTVTESAGLTQEAYGKQTDTAAHDLNVFKQEVLDLAKQFGDELLPVLVDDVLPFLKNDLMPFIETTVIPVFKLFVKVITGLVEIWNKFLEGIAWLGTTSGKAAGAILRLFGASPEEWDLGEGFQHGGIVPGSGPVPIMAHGGETVLPRGVSPTNINVTVNTGPVGSGVDVNMMAEVISRKIAEKTAWRGAI